MFQTGGKKRDIATPTSLPTPISLILNRSKCRCADLSLSVLSFCAKTEKNKPFEIPGGSECIKCKKLCFSIDKDNACSLHVAGMYFRETFHLSSSNLDFWRRIREKKKFNAEKLV